MNFKIQIFFFIVTFMLSATAAYACRTVKPSTTAMIHDAEVVVRAEAVAYALEPKGEIRTLGTPGDAIIKFKVNEVLKGASVSNEITLNGYLSDRDDFNEIKVPYDFVRPNGRGGSCHAYEYKKGAEFLLFLRKAGEKYTVNWYALAPTNEQLHSSDDEWITWVRNHLKTLGAAVEENRFDQDLFDKFVTMRVGTGEPVYWYCIGEIYSYPEGKLVARVEGVDAARLVKSESNATRRLQLSRKIFFYRDPLTNEVLRAFNNQKVEPIAYPYQQITYELKDGKLQSGVVQGKQPRVQTIASTGENRVRRFGDTIVFSAPLFLNFPAYKAYENYDFFYQPGGGKQLPFQLSWNRRGNLPQFFGGGDSVFQLVSYRVDKYEALPKSIRDVLEQDAPLWKQPPRDLNEIRELQKP